METLKNKRKVRILSIFLSDKASLNIILAIISFLASFGFLFGTPRVESYAQFFVISPAYIWALLFAIHGVMCSLRAFNYLPIKGNIIRSFLGLWLWCSLVSSTIVLDKTQMTPTEPLIFALVAAELWSLAYSMFVLSYSDNSEGCYGIRS